MPKVTIVIPLYDYVGIDAVLDSIRNNSGCERDVIVIDNSQDPAKQAAITLKMANHPEVRYYKQTANLGVTGGRNKGFEYANGADSYVLFLDHDVSLRDDCLCNLVRDFEAIERREPIGILTGKIVYKSDPGQIWAAGTDNCLFSGKIHFHCGRDSGQFEAIRQVGVAPSIIFTRASLVRTLGGFDNLFFANYDDAEFCFRYRKHGFPTFYSPHVVGFHDIPLAAPNDNRLLDRGYHVARNRILFMRRYARCYPLFLLFIPLWCAYYFWLYAKNRRTADFADYWRGTRDGLGGR